jgi:hypothetical protein
MFLLAYQPLVCVQYVTHHRAAWHPMGTSASSAANHGRTSSWVPRRVPAIGQENILPDRFCLVAVAVGPVQYVRCPISTLCVGQAASMASLLLAAGEPGERRCLPNARIMVHQPIGGAQVIWQRAKTHKLLLLVLDCQAVWCLMHQAAGIPCTYETVICH